MTITIGRQAGAFASTLALTALGLVIAGPASAADADTLRLGGSDRYATSAEISEETFEAGVDVAYLASGVNYPDALAGGAVAGHQGAPVLLTKPDAIPAVIAAELERLNPGKIVVLGGESAISASVVTAADAYTGGTVERIAGDNRYDTAGDVAMAGFPSGAATVFVASGENFPDALGGAAAAAELGGPVLLTKANDLPKETQLALTQLEPTRVVVLGGETAVSKAVATELAAYDADETIERFAGLDRFSTSADTSAKTFTSATTVYLANGIAFPDALSGAPAAASDDAPILLVKSDAVSQAVCDEVNRLQPTKVVALGGKTAISDAVLTTVSETCLADASINASVINAVTESDDEVDFNEGDEVTYTVTVTNTSAVTLSHVAVAGTVGSAFELPEATENVLAPGASLTFTATYTITAEDMDESIVTNTITATGTAPDATVVSKAVVSTWNPAEG